MDKKIVISALSVLSLSVCVFAHAESLENNQGSLYSRRAPETKKGTIVFQGINKEPRVQAPAVVKEKELSNLQQQARAYRVEGYAAQNIGDIATALSFYQKAVELDPAYAAVYNDLGVISESQDDPESARDYYLKAVSLDPYFASAYTNLALYYEEVRDLQQAAYYWSKRIECGDPGDSWTQKAAKRLEDIRLVLGTKTDISKEKQVIGLLDEVKNQRINYTKPEKTPSEVCFDKAKEHYKKKDYASAIKEALDAAQLDPANKDIDKFIDEVRTKALSQ